MSFDPDNIYEGEVRYVNTQVRFGSSDAPAPPNLGTSLGNQYEDPTTINQAKTPQSPRKKSFSRGMMLFAVISLILILLLLIGIVIQIAVTNGMTGNQAALKNDEVQETNKSMPFQSLFQNDKVQETNKSMPFQSIPFIFPSIRSCNEIRRLGFIHDGIYYIKPDKNRQPLEVYCDMTTAQGGWTPVASIHENDIVAKCSPGDMWATYLSENEYKHGSTHWESDVVFGDLRSCTRSDYKNIGYSTITASNVMVWHVPSETMVENLKSSTEISYRTYTSFLTSYGGNMKSLFQKHFPLKVDKDSQLLKILKILTSKAKNIRKQFSDWVDYTYEGNTEISKITNDRIYNPDGNEIYIGCGHTPGPMTYDKETQYCSDSSWKSVTTEPFMLLSVISNEQQNYDNFDIEIRSSRSNPDNVSLLHNNITQENYKLSYLAVQFVNEFDPTVCEYHFVVSNTKKWASIEPALFHQTVDQNTGTQRRNRFQATGKPSNIIMGYMLLTRTRGSTVTVVEANIIARIILSAMLSAENLFGENRATKIANAIAGQSDSIKSAIPDWYDLSDDWRRSSSVTDSNLHYIYGSQVYFSDESYQATVYYGAKSTITKGGSSMKSKKTKPLIFVSAVSNESRKYARTTLQVYRYPHGEYEPTHLSNNITKSSYTIQYRSTQFVSGPTRATPCEFFFVISSPEKWRSSNSISVSHIFTRSRRTTNQIIIDDHPTNIVVGHMLLARKSGKNFTTAYTDDVAEVILDTVSKIQRLFNELPGSDSLAVPTIFTKGSPTSLMNTIPPNFRRHVQTGYLQFRALNAMGLPNALCAGVRVKSNSPEYVCIGGLSNDVKERGTCGDFAGWQGTKTDHLDALEANGSAHSLKDMSSTILIFYR